MEKKININLQLTGRELIIFLCLALILFPALSLNSETLTLTTYYPAPYGGYANLLTTSNTWLARENGLVGIGVRNPSAKLDIAGTTRIRSSNGLQSQVYVNANGTLMTGTEVPAVPPAPNGSRSNVETNDVYLRSTGKWVSQNSLSSLHIINENYNMPRFHRYHNTCCDEGEIMLSITGIYRDNIFDVDPIMVEPIDKRCMKLYKFPINKKTLKLRIVCAPDLGQRITTWNH